MSIINEIEILINKIESLLKNQNLQLNENTEINDLIKTKRELIRRIKKEFFGNDKGIKKIIFLFKKREDYPINFLQYLQRQLYYLENLIKNEINTENINEQIILLNREFQIILLIEDSKEFKEFLNFKSKEVLNEKINEKEIPKKIYHFLILTLGKTLIKECIEKEIIIPLIQIYNNLYDLNGAQYLFRFGIEPILKDTIYTEFSNEKDNYLKFWNTLKNITNTFENYKVEVLFVGGITPILKNTFNSKFYYNINNYLEFIKEVEFILKDMLKMCNRYKSKKSFGIGLGTIIYQIFNKNLIKNNFELINFLKQIKSKVNICGEDVLFVIMRNIYFKKKNFFSIENFKKSKLKILNDFSLSETCSDLEDFTENIFKTKKKFILIKYESTIIGHIKLSGEKTFLSYVDFLNEEKVSLIKGGVYSINKKFKYKLLLKKLDIGDKILILNIGSIKLNLMRLININLILKIDTFIEDLKKTQKDRFIEKKTQRDIKDFFRNFFNEELYKI